MTACNDNNYSYHDSVSCCLASDTNRVVHMCACKNSYHNSLYFLAKKYSYKSISYV